MFIDIDFSEIWGEETLFAYAERSDLDSAHKREEIETDSSERTPSKLGKRPSRSLDIRRTYLLRRLSLEEARGGIFEEVWYMLLLYEKVPQPLCFPERWAMISVGEPISVSYSGRDGTLRQLVLQGK